MTKWTDIPHGTITAAEQRLWVALGDDAGIVAIRINSDQNFVTQLAKFAVQPWPKSTNKTIVGCNLKWLEARRLMGRNYFGVEEAMLYFRITPSISELFALSEIPWSEEVLASVKDTHILVAVFPLSIIDIRTKFRADYLLTAFDGFEKERVANNVGSIGWKLIRKAPIRGSALKPYDDQKELLAKSDEVPDARVMVYAISAHFKATGNHMFPAIRVRCCDYLDDHRVVEVGMKNGTGVLDISWTSDGCGTGGLALASCRKPWQ